MPQGRSKARCVLVTLLGTRLVPSIGRLLREPEDSFAENVALHLVGAAVDRRSWREESHFGDQRQFGYVGECVESRAGIKVVGVERSGRSGETHADVARQA